MSRAYRSVVVHWCGYAKRFDLAGPVNRRTVRAAMSRLLGVRFVAPFTYEVGK